MRYCKRHIEYNVLLFLCGVSILLKRAFLILVEYPFSFFFFYFLPCTFAVLRSVKQKHHIYIFLTRKTNNFLQEIAGRQTNRQTDRKSTSKLSMTMTEDAPPNHTIYIKNLNDKIKQDRLKQSLYASFSPHGKILEIVMGKARKLRGQAWITFDDITMASNALRSMNGTVFFEKTLVIQFAKDKADVIARREGTFKQNKKLRRRRLLVLRNPVQKPQVHHLLCIKIYQTKFFSYKNYQNHVIMKC
jgi:RNA recognition motif-containing protein